MPLWQKANGLLSWLAMATTRIWQTYRESLSETNNWFRKKLEGLGFLVTTYSDVTRASFEKSIKEFVSKAKGAEAIVVYYAGHGIESNGINYLLPTDARLDERDDAEFQGIPLDRVLVKVGEAGAQKFEFWSCWNGLSY